MREILFRGKSKESGEWIEGNLIHRTEFYGDPIDDYHILRVGEFHSDYYESEEVHPETIGQFTGLTDENGKKVFEGDVLSQRNKVRVVKFEMSCGSCCTQVIGFGASGEKTIDFIQLTEPFEIIGNIHDNPELLKGDNK